MRAGQGQHAIAMQKCGIIIHAIKHLPKQTFRTFHRLCKQARNPSLYGVSFFAVIPFVAGSRSRRVMTPSLYPPFLPQHSSPDIPPFWCRFPRCEYRNYVILYNHFSAILASDHLACGQKSYAGSSNCFGLQSEHGKAPVSDMFLLQMPSTAFDPWRLRLRPRQGPALSSRYEPRPSEDRCCQ
jgi:hypothetical protein